MRDNLWMRRVGWLGAVAAILLSGAFAQAEDEPALILLQDSADNQGSIADPQPEVKLGEFWIGVACNSEALDNTLRAQLGLPEGQGLAVLSVVPDSPAAKAGLKENDVLLDAGGKPLGKIQDLVDAVEAAKDQELALSLLRDGKPLSLTVKPEKRPEGQRPEGRQSEYEEAFRNWLERGGGGGDQEILRRWFQGRNGVTPHRMIVPRPGFVLPPGTPTGTAFPKDLSVSITKEGDQPAKIVVKQGDKNWETTEDKLGDLPEEIRGHVESFLGRRQFAISVQELQVPPRYRAPKVAPHVLRPDDARFDEIQKQLEQLKQSLEALEKKLAPSENK
jgi:membrane-associated protease RseP (regulator of RpoE activity)